MTHRIRIPSINDELADFDNLFRLWNEVSEKGSVVQLDFTDCSFLRQNAVAFLGGMIAKIESRGRSVSIDESTLSQPIEMNLKQNGFLYLWTAVPPAQMAETHHH